MQRTIFMADFAIELINVQKIINKNDGDDKKVV